LKNISIFFFIISTTLSCTYNKNYTCISYLAPFENYNEKGVLENKIFLQKIKIFELNNEICIILPGITEFPSNTLLHNTESYIIYYKDNVYGFYYQFNSDLKNKYLKQKVNIDSFLSVLAFGKLNFDLPNNLYKKTINEFDSTLFVQYKLINEKDNNLYDLITLKLRKFEIKPVFNLSNSIDSTYKKTLFFYSLYKKSKKIDTVKEVKPDYEYKSFLEVNKFTDQEYKSIILKIENLKKID
jgi:hypothetical protein